MSIVASSPHGCFVDEMKYFEDVYGKSRYTMRPEFYQIDEPFLMQSQVDAINKTVTSESQTVDEAVVAFRSTRKRKRKTSVDKWSSEMKQIIGKVKSAHLELRRFQTEIDGAKSTIKTPLNGNRTARETAKAAEDVAITLPLSKLKCGRTPNDRKDNSMRLECGFWRNESGDFCQLQAADDGQRFVIPPGSSFFVGDVHQAFATASTYDTPLKDSFDVIVVDPPWENKAVKRQKSYCWERECRLLELPPLGDLLSPSGLLAIWGTNSERLQTFVTSALLSKWRLRLAGVFYWLKVTTSGEPVFPLEHSDTHKLPFEPIYICRKESETTSETSELDFKLIQSVPSAIPSRKPPLFDIFEQMVPNSTKKHRRLELFCRCLHPNTVGIGFEAIKFQSIGPCFTAVL